MNGSHWLPGLVVLIVGLAIGLGAALRLRQQSNRDHRSEADDILLKIRDLEGRRDELYERLRRAQEEDADPADRGELELAAARTLRELDRLQDHLPPEERARPPAEPSTAERPPTRGTARHPLLIGFAFGASMVGLVAVLLYLALRDAQPRQEPEASVVQSVPGESPHPPGDPVPEEVAQRIGELEARLASDPSDIMALKELALVHLSATQFVESFERAQQLLRLIPDDPDGLYVQGVVRLTMGQYAVALELLDRVLAQYPDHRRALLYRGLALYQSGELEPALDTWELGVELAGGSDPELEHLITMAREGELRAPATEPEPRTVDLPAPKAGRYGVLIELAPSAQAPPGAVLFVFLRPTEGGPPVAVKRIGQPVFPLELSVSSADSMMGAEIPDLGTLVARLDSDGSVSTRSDTDLDAQSPAEMGTTTRLVLGR